MRTQHNKHLRLMCLLLGEYQDVFKTVILRIATGFDDHVVRFCGMSNKFNEFFFDVSFQVYLVRNGENVCPKIVVIASKVSPHCSMMYSLYADNIRSRPNVKKKVN